MEVTNDRRRAPRPQVLLIADDTEALRYLWSVWLRRNGFDVVEASTGAEAVDLARRLHPFAILMDLAMPVMDGLEATRRLKQDTRTADVPVVMVTAYTSDHYRRAAHEAGCVAFVEKPADEIQLLQALREACSAT